MRIGSNLIAVGQLLVDSLPTGVVRTETYVRWRHYFSATPARFEPPPEPVRPFTMGEWRGRKLASAKTDLVIEGFPGSGNSFVSNSLRDAVDAPANIESHFHYTAQLKRALALGVPAVVVVRDPAGACRSLKAKEPELCDELIVARWLLYHRFVWHHRRRLFIFRFADLIEDVDLVRRRCPPVHRLLARPIMGNAAYHRTSEQTGQFNEARVWVAGLLRMAERLYHRLGV